MSLGDSFLAKNVGNGQMAKNRNFTNNVRLPGSLS
jgi:hypothetical protein